VDGIATGVFLLPQTDRCLERTDTPQAMRPPISMNSCHAYIAGSRASAGAQAGRAVPAGGVIAAGRHRAP
jgi:hypothetical protein